jgi:hypothetical protein
MAEKNAAVDVVRSISTIEQAAHQQAMQAVQIHLNSSIEDQNQLKRQVEQLTDALSKVTLFVLLPCVLLCVAALCTVVCCPVCYRPVCCYRSCN